MSNLKSGIDVSEWQGVIDWEKVKPHIDFALIRLGFGKGTGDKCAERNIAECNRLGIPYGLTWMSYAYTVDMAENEAKSALALMGTYGATPTYGIWFDWEYDSRNYAAGLGVQVSNDLLRSMAATFCDTTQAAGYEAGIYANADYANNYFGADLLGRYPLWYAYLQADPERDVRVHQYSWTGRIDGINGNVDMDTWYPPTTDNSSAPTTPEATTETKKEECVVNVPMIRNGSAGASVTALQTLLVGYGYSCGSYGADGKFGAATESAVRAYQQANGLTVDGIVGPATWGKLLGA